MSHSPLVNSPVGLTWSTRKTAGSRATCGLEACLRVKMSISSLHSYWEAFLPLSLFRSWSKAQLGSLSFGASLLCPRPLQLSALLL